MRNRIALSVLVAAASVVVLAKAGDRSFLVEEFRTLDRWEPLVFGHEPNESSYTTVEVDGASALEIRFDDSASGIVTREAYPTYDYPILRWRWRVAGVISGGDATTKSGDDYPIRIYVMFEHDPGTMSVLDRLRGRAYRLFYGRYPPHSALNYIWANRDHETTLIESPYTDQSMMIVVDAGAEYVGRWREYEVNIIDDYRRAFGTDPPTTARIGIMGDGDQTGASGMSWIDYLTIEG